MHSAQASRLLKSLFGPAATPRDCAVIGGGVGLISGLGPMYEAEPLLFFVPFAWFLYVLSRTYSFVKEPRRDDWPFLLGLSYENRRKLVLDFLRQKSIELCIVCLASVLAFLAIRSALYRDFAFSETISGAGVMFAEILVSFGLFFASIKLRIVWPSKNDVGILSRLFSFVPDLFRTNSGTSLSRFSFSLPILSYDQNILLRRQLLYLYRVSPFNSLFFVLFGVLLYGLILVFTPGYQVLFLSLFSCAPPVIILMELTTIMSESAQKLGQCPYYSFPVSSVFKANCLLSFAIVALFPFALFAKIIFVSHDISFLTLLRLASVTAADISLILFFGVRFGLDAWDGKTTALLCMVILCCLLGISIPYAGILFPIGAAILVFLLR